VLPPPADLPGHRAEVDVLEVRLGGLEAQLDVPQSLEAPDHETGADHERKTERHFERDENADRAPRAPRGGGAAGTES